MAATLIYLNIDFGSGWVAGESTAKGYESRIEIESFGWGLKVKNRRDKDAGSTKSLTTLVPEVLKLEKFFDASSTALVKNMKDQKPFTIARLTFADMVLSDTAPQKIMQIVLMDGHVEDVRLSSSGSGKGMSVKETVSLSFRKIEMTYFPPGATKDVRASSGIPWGFDQPWATA